MPTEQDRAKALEIVEQVRGEFADERDTVETINRIAAALEGERDRLSFCVVPRRFRHLRNGKVIVVTNVDDITPEYEFYYEGTPKTLRFMVRDKFVKTFERISEGEEA